MAAVQATEKRFCIPGVPNAAPHTLLTCARPQGNALQAQLLFTFYVHSSLIRFKHFPAEDLFHGTLVPNLTHAGMLLQQLEKSLIYAFWMHHHDKKRENPMLCV